MSLYSITIQPCTASMWQLIQSIKSISLNWMFSMIHWNIHMWHYRPKQLSLVFWLIWAVLLELCWALLYSRFLRLWKCWLISFIFFYLKIRKSTISIWLFRKNNSKFKKKITNKVENKCLLLGTVILSLISALNVALLLKLIYQCNEH